VLVTGGSEPRRAWLQRRMPASVIRAAPPRPATGRPGTVMTAGDRPDMGAAGILGR
jgi:hypothetical protein